NHIKNTPQITDAGRSNQTTDVTIQTLESKAFEEETDEDKLARTYITDGRFREAEILCHRLVEKRKTVLGPEHVHTLNSMHNLAFSYFKQCKYKKAEQIYVQVVEKRKSVLGLEHVDTLN